MLPDGTSDHRVSDVTFVGDVSFSADGTHAALIQNRRGGDRLLLLDVAGGTTAT